jgi:hypothetical protein
MQAYIWGTEAQLHSFLTSALNGGECLTSHPAALSQERNAVLTKQKIMLALELARTFQRREKSLASTRIQIPDHPDSSLVTTPTTTFIHITKKIINVTRCIY